MKIGGLREDILFESREYPLALPKKDSRGDFGFPPGTPLKRPKGGCGPPLETRPRFRGSCGGRGTIGRGRAAGVVGPYGCNTGSAQRQRRGDPFFPAGDVGSMDLISWEKKAETFA